MPDTGPFTTTQMFIPGFSISMTPAQIPFPFGFFTSGPGLDAHPMFSLQNPKKDGTSGSKVLSPRNPTCAKFNFSDNSTLLGSFAGNPSFTSISKTSFHSLLSVFTEPNGGMNLRPSSTANKTCSTYVKQRPRSLHSTIFIYSTRKQILSLQPLRRRRAHSHPQNPKQKTCHKRNVISLSISKIILVCGKLCYKKF